MTLKLIRAAALAIVAVASLVTAPAASAGLSPSLFRLLQPNGHLAAEWFLQPDTSSFVFEYTEDTTEGVDGYWTNGTRFDLQPGDFRFTAPFPLSPGTYSARVWTTTTPEICAADPGDPQCARQPSNVQTTLIRIPKPAVITDLRQAGAGLSATWSLPPGVGSILLEVAPSPNVNFEGFFEDLVAEVLLGPQQTSATTGSLPPGIYYVHVMSSQTFDICDASPDEPLCLREFSAPVAVRVSAGGATSPAPGSPGSASASDKVVSLGAITASSSQDVDKLSITLNAGEAVKVKLSGSVNVPGASKVYRFKTVSRSLAAGKRKLSLTLPKKAKKAVKKALKRKKRLKAKLTLVVTDAAGNAQTKKYTVRLRP